MKLELSESFKCFLEDFFVSAMGLGKESGKRFKRGMQNNHEKYLVALLLAIEKKVRAPSSFTVDFIAFEAGGEKYLAEAKKLLEEEEKHPQERIKQKKVKVS